METSSGIKLLLSMKGSSECDKSFESEEEKDYVEEITDEEYKKNINEMDDLIFDIIRTKQKLRLGKLKCKIKTRQDLLDFMNIKDKNENLIPPEPCLKNSAVIFDHLNLNKTSQTNNDFNLIKEKLKKQENILNLKKSENENKDNLFLTTQFTSNKENDEMSLLYEQIKQAESRCDDLLENIDECIKLGEDLEEIIDSNK
jgi:hypothetical protein